ADPRSDPMSEPSPTAEVMPPPAAPAPKKPARLPWDLMIGLVVGVGIAYLGVVYAFPDRKPEPDTKNTLEPVRLRAAAPRLDDVLYVGRQPEERQEAPEIDGGVAWLNSGGPLALKKDLKGKIVLLDFWTLCCINCIHIQPDLLKLEKKYANE